MTPTERAIWERVQRRTFAEAPTLEAAILRAIATLRARLEDPAVARLVAQALATGDVDALARTVLTEAVLDAAFQPVRDAARTAVARGARAVARELPRQRPRRATPPITAPPPIAPPIASIAPPPEPPLPPVPPRLPPGLPPAEPPLPTVGVRFDLLNPDVVTAVRTMETRAIGTMQADIRETVRQTMERGLTAGQNPTVIARELRGVLGLAPNQEAAVQHFRQALEAGDRRALGYRLRDARYDRTLAKALGEDGTGLSKPQVEKMVTAYRRRMVSRNAETMARTLAHEAYAVGQKAAIADGVRSGALDGSRMVRKWIGVGDAVERPEHLAMNNTVVPWDAPYPNGDAYAGQGSPWNCRCRDLFLMR